jgi:hypothetical protein
MAVVFVVGRVLLVLYFVLDALQCLMNVAGVAEALAQAVAIRLATCADHPFAHNGRVALRAATLPRGTSS